MFNTPNQVDNLDDIPISDWNYYSKKYPIKKYFWDLIQELAHPYHSYRGCPYSCFNCTYPLQQVGKLDLELQKMLLKIKHWVGKLKTNKFIFRDPVFSINRKYTVDLGNNK